jgi:hypothetical protein
VLPLLPLVLPLPRPLQAFLRLVVVVQMLLWLSQMSPMRHSPLVLIQMMLLQVVVVL